jgi:hypothetical protein
MGPDNIAGLLILAGTLGLYWLIARAARKPRRVPRPPRRRGAGPRRRSSWWEDLADVILLQRG